MAIQLLYPTIAPSLNLDFANTRTLDPRITFTRASAATFFDQFGVLRTAAADAPRFDHNPVTGESLGLLIEEQRTNLLVRSEEFNEAAWTKTRASITANAIVAPDGTLTADKLVEDTTASNTHFINRSVTVSGSTNYTLSVFTKAGERSLVFLRFGPNASIEGGLGASAAFDLSAGVILGAQAGTATISNVGNGFYRCSLTALTASGVTSTQPEIRLLPPGWAWGATSNYTGDGTSGIYIWGAQLEAGAFPTSYIKTEASQVTRSADVAVMTGTNFSSWYRQDEGALLVDYSRPWAVPSSAIFPRTASIGTAGSNSNVIELNGAINGEIFTVRAGNVDQAAILSAVSGSGRHAGAYKLDDFAAALSGTLATPDTSGTVPTVNQLVIGNRQDGIRALNGHIRKLAYYPRRLSNAQLQALTT
jgi:hypothetical protein